MRTDAELVNAVIDGEKRAFAVLGSDSQGVNLKGAFADYPIPTLQMEGK